ncbi:MAG: metallophosphoesterase [Clostridia bacterium]|nr:metallophosphoesterase [Clostridia bacterium]
MTTSQTYEEFSRNGYLTAPANTVAVNVSMWGDSDLDEVYILNREHNGVNGVCTICGCHTHTWSEWEHVTVPTANALGTDQRVCECGEMETREVEGVWQIYKLSDHLLELPEGVCSSTNLWALLPHESVHFTSGKKWGNTTTPVTSITIPVNPGDKLFATSWQSAGLNGHDTSNGIRVTFFDAYGIVQTMGPGQTDRLFYQNGGYLEAPAGTIAINIAMWYDSTAYEVYILNREHIYTTVTIPATCTEQGWTTYTCTTCGDEYEADFTEPTGHSYENGACADCDIPLTKITLGDFAVAGVGKTALSSSTVLLSQKSLIAVPYCGASLHINVGKGYQVKVHSGDNHNNINQASDWLNNGDTYALPLSSIYMRVSIRRADADKITQDDFVAADITVSYVSNSDIIADNADVADILQNTDLPILLHLSDIHGDVIRADRAASFAEHVGADALLASGDLTAYQPDDWGKALFDAVGNHAGVNFLYGIGNHDASGINADAYHQTIYNSYFKDNPLTPNGEVYYYKDLENQKLRVISVNQQEGATTTTSGGTCYSQAQVDWLVETLQTTPQGYGVIMMYHSPEARIASAGNSAYAEFFQTENRYDNPTNSYSGYTGTFLMDIVDAFMLRENFVWSYSEKEGASPVTLHADFTNVAEGVEFIAHVTGHVHSDSITYLPGTVCKQLLLGVTCTTSMYGEDGGYYGLADYSDLSRTGNTASQDAFNAYVIDRRSKTVRVLRVGAKQTVSGETRADMTIPYSVPFEKGEYLFDTEGLVKLDLSKVEWVNYGIQEYGTEPTYLPGLRWSPNVVFDVPYEGVTFYIKINAPYELGIRSGVTDTTMSTNYHWLNNRELVGGNKNRGYAYTIPAGHTKFIFSMAFVSRNDDHTVITDRFSLDMLDLEAAGIEIWYSPDPDAQIIPPFKTEDKTQLDLSCVEWVNYGIQADGTNEAYLPGARISPNMIFDVPYEGVSLYIKINAPYEVGIRSGVTDTTMDVNHYWLNNKYLISSDKNQGFVYTIPTGHTKFLFSVANISRNASGTIIESQKAITLEELQAVGLEIWYVPQHEHTYTTVTIPATCEHGGWTVYTCACGDSYEDDFTDLTWHTYENNQCVICECDMLRVKRDDLVQYQGGVDSESGNLNTTFTNNWYADIRIPQNAEQVRVLTFKTGGAWGSAFLQDGEAFILGHCDKLSGGQWITLDVPADATVFRYGYLYDEIAEKNGFPSFEYLEFAGNDLQEPEQPPYMQRPSTGCHAFSVDVNIAPAKGEPDGYEKGTDYGYIQLPTNYDPYGEPVRLIIVCHGAGAELATYQSNAWKNTNYSFWTELGYAVMDMFACPPALSEDNSALHYGNPVVLDCYKAGYQYVMEHFNLKKDGIFLIGASMGGLSSFQIAQSEEFDVIAQVGYCPVIDLFKQAYCNPWTTASYQRSRIASYFGFTGEAPTFTNAKYPSDAEIAYFEQNLDKILAYSPILNAVVAGDPTTIFDVIPNSALANNAQEQEIYDQLTATHPNPLMIFHNLDDTTVSYRYSKYYVEMLKRNGQDATLYTFETGGHNAWANGESYEVQGINKKITIKESQYQAYLYFSGFEQQG